jgi:hypothetical protein
VPTNTESKSPGVQVQVFGCGWRPNTADADGRPKLQTYVPLRHSVFPKLNSILSTMHTILNNTASGRISSFRIYSERLSPARQRSKRAVKQKAIAAWEKEYLCLEYSRKMPPDWWKPWSSKKSQMVSPICFATTSKVAKIENSRKWED